MITIKIKHIGGWGDWVVEAEEVKHWMPMPPMPPAIAAEQREVGK